MKNDRMAVKMCSSCRSESLLEEGSQSPLLEKLSLTGKERWLRP
jgi:hypothetical protein